MATQTGTKQRILDVARELFISKGVMRTSLQEIASHLGVTKPALYYHFSSREDIVRSIVEPLIDEGEAFVQTQESLERVNARELLEGYFDFHFRNRKEIVLVLSELTTLTELGLIDSVLTWRSRLAALLVGRDAPLAATVAAVVALGGLQDCTMQFADSPPELLREVTVTAALAALGRDSAR